MTKETHRKKKIQIQLEVNESELIKFLMLTEIPFDLPAIVELPTGTKELSKRAKLLMLAGLEHLKSIYPKKQITDNQGINEKKQIDGWI